MDKDIRIVRSEITALIKMRRSIIKLIATEKRVEPFDKFFSEVVQSRIHVYADMILDIDHKIADKSKYLAYLEDSVSFATMTHSEQVHMLVNGINDIYRNIASTYTDNVDVDKIEDTQDKELVTYFQDMLHDRIDEALD